MRWIVYVDMDAFYVACERRANPKLNGRPVIVGPKPESPDSRGVVLSASYEARPFGVRSAMPAVRAAELCPQAVWVEPDFEKYERTSREVLSVLRERVPVVVPMSIDEAALAVEADGPADVERLARELQTDLRTRLSLSASVGAAPYRIVAKIASDRAKPGGVAVVPPEDTVSFLSALPVRVVPGVGPKTEAILRDMGVERVGDLVGLRLVPARRRLGQFADELVALARGKIRESPIEVEAAPRQRSVDRTFARDESDPGEIARTLAEMAEDLGRALARETLRYQTVTLRFRWSDFTAEQRSRTLHGAHEGPVPLRETAVRMAHDLLRPRPGSKVRRVRTIALVASRLSVRTGRQSRLDSYEAAAGTAN